MLGALFLVLLGLAAALGIVGHGGGGLAFAVLPAAVVIAPELWSAVFLVLPVVILLFPDGRLPRPFRMVLWAYLDFCALITDAFVAAGAREVSNAPIVVDDKGQLVNNPGPSVPLIVFIVVLAAVPVFWVSFVVRQMLSWRQATGERRAQLK
jgi:hypothetical protein